MKILKIKDMTGGWFVGNFEPSAFKTDDFEVSYKIHPKGESWPKHYHKKATEINYLIRGKMENDGVELNAGDVFIINPNEIVVPNFLEDCEVICVKTCSDKNDKYIVE